VRSERGRDARGECGFDLDTDCVSGGHSVFAISSPIAAGPRQTIAALSLGQRAANSLKGKGEKNSRLWVMPIPDIICRAPYGRRQRVRCVSRRVRAASLALHRVLCFSTRPDRLHDINPARSAWTIALVLKVPEGPEWTYELKLHGYRHEVVRTGTETRLYSRRENLLKRVPLHRLGAPQAAARTVIDGELVARVRMEA